MSKSQTTLTEVEKAMQWERMSGDRLSDAERARVEAGGAFHPPGDCMSADHSQTTRRVIAAGASQRS